MPPSCEDLILEVTLRKSGGYRLRAFAGFPLDLTTAKPLEGFEDVAFPLHEWLQGEHPTIKALEPLLVERSRVRFCYDPSEPYLNLLPLEDVFARRFGVLLSRYLLTKAGALATPYAEDVSVSGKLKVLLIYANPEPKRFPAGGRDPVHLPYLKEHFYALVQALSGLVRQQLIVFESLDSEDGRLTTQHIIGRIKTFNPHILVYVGHGYHDLIYQRNGLYWGDRDAERLPFALLRATLAEMGQRQGDDEKPSLRVLVLIACHSAKAGVQLQTPTFSESEGIQEVQVPAVVGMDREFPAAAVAAFSAPFFGAVSERRSMEEAFIEALRALRESSDPVIKQANVLLRFYLTASHSYLFPPPEDCARGLYLEKVKGEYGQVQFSNRITTVPLKDLYVDRVVVERKEDIQLRQQRTPAPPVSERLAQLERHAIEPPEKVVELWKALQDHHRLLVTAEARTGKSTLCQHVLMSCDQQTRWLPIFVRFSDFSHSSTGLRAFLQENHAKSLGLDKLTVLTGIGESAQEVPLGEWLYLQWEAGNALLIVDGLDEEFNDKQRATALSRIPLIADKQKQPRVLFTSRPFGMMLVKDVYVLRLKEFEKDDQLRRCTLNCERILARLEGYDADEQRVTNFLKALNEDRRRKDLARRPGHLVEMYVQFCDTGVVSPFEDDLMEWVAQERFNVIGLGRTDPPLKPNEPTDRRLIMDEVGFHMLFCRQTVVLLRAAMLSLIREAKKSTQFANIAQTDILNDLVRNSGFLHEMRLDGKDAYKVESVPWLQFFAASYLARRLRDGDKALTSWVFEDTEWRCPLCPHRTLPSFRTYVQTEAWEAPILLLLGFVETKSLEESLLHLFEECFDDSWQLLLDWLLRALSRCRDGQPSIVQAVCNDVLPEVLRSDWPIIEEGVSDLGRVRVRANLDPILKYCVRALYDDEDWQIQENAAYVLGWLGDVRAVKPLIAVLNPDWGLEEDVRRAAAFALGRIGDVRAVKLLIAALVDLDDVELRWIAADSLALIGEGSVEPLIAALREIDSWDLRWAVARVLEQIGGAATEALITTLKDEDADVRWVVASTLGEIGDTGSIPALVQVREGDPVDGIRNEAQKALDCIAKKNRICISPDSHWEPALEGEEGRFMV